MGFKHFVCSIFLIFNTFKGITCYRNCCLTSFTLIPDYRIDNLYNSSSCNLKKWHSSKSKGTGINGNPALFSHTELNPAENRLKGEFDGVNLREKYKLLHKVNSVSDLKGIPEDLLPELCNEIRGFLGDVISRVGGHFSGSLGVVELTVALHYVFDSPFDKIVWDIGHQSYVHKMLTGRRDKLSTIKKRGGLSGFCRLYESDHDVFGAGHSSTSISSLQGLLEGYMLRSRNPKNAKEDPEEGVGGNADRKFVCVIGDGGMTGGMAYESLNYAINIKTPLVVVYNDNEQVSLPTGMNSVIGTKPVVPFFLQESSKKEVKSARRALNDLLEELERGDDGLKIIGPIDGHNLADLLYLFKKFKYPETDEGKPYEESKENENKTSNEREIQLMGRKVKGPIIVHIKTVKGFCCPEALQQLDRMHGIKPNTKLTIVNPPEGTELRPFVPEPSELKSVDDGGKVEFEEKDYEMFDKSSFCGVFSNTLIKMAEVEPEIVAVTAAMPGGTGIGRFGSYFPRRTFDVGICEQHAVTFCGGLSLAGMKPYCALYSTFIQRGFDQVVHDIVIQDLPVKFIIDRAGYVGEDGLSHHGNYDLNLFRVFKNVTTMAPSNQIELALMLQLSSNLEGPCVIRYPKDNVPKESLLNYYPPDLYDHIKYYRYLGNDKEASPPKSVPSYNLALGNKEEGRRSYDLEWEEIRNFRSKRVRTGSEVTILCLGPVLYDVLAAVEQLGITPTVVDMRFLNPLDLPVFEDLEPNHRFLITVEEGVSGGLGTAVLEHLSDSNKLSHFKVRSIRYPKEFIHHATRKEQKQMAGMDAEGISRQIQKFLSE